MRSIDMKSFAACAALALTLAGCSDGAPSNNLTSIQMVNPGSDRLKALSPLNQRIGLMRAIRDSGKRCRNVQAVGYQQEFRRMAMWVALCSDGRHWSIFIAPNEDIQVRDCAENAQLDLPVCRPVAPMPPDPNAPAGAEGKATTNGT
jgi:hypothetical protein